MVDNKKLSIGHIFKNTNFQKILIAILTFVVIFFISSTSIIPKKYDLKEGDVAPVDIKAPRDFTDDAATQARINSTIASLPLRYNKNLDIQKNAVDALNVYFNKAIEIKALNIDEKAKIDKLKAETLIKISQEDYLATLKLDEKDIKTLSEFLVNTLVKILSQDIRANTEDDIKKAQADLNFYIQNAALTKSMKELCGNIGITLIKPNLIYDDEKTEEYRSQAKKQVEPVIIKKNQNIVLKGEIITAQHIAQMKKVGLLQQNARVDREIYSGLALLIIIIEFLISIYIYMFRKNIFESNSKLLIISIVICVNAIFTAAVNIISVYIIPAGFVVMLLSLIFDPFFAFMISMPCAIISSCITNFNFEVILLCIIGCSSGILFMKNVHQRNSVLTSGIFIGITNGVVLISMGLINNNSIYTSIINSGQGVVGGLLSAILSIGILPVFEQLFDIITPIKLLELSNPNQPLLKKMLFEAPGTYHHSILVGNLAEAAADEVGANTILARVGSYYHDIGKIKRPYFFKENQITNDNPHDKITPKLSTLIITSHVKDGLELADHYKLPGNVKDIIEQHHGTTLVKYFYARAISDSSENIGDTSFRYEGPKPKSKEAAIILLADSVEAAVRSLNNPSTIEMEKMLNKIVKEKIDDGQLDNAELTMMDISKIKQSFRRVLEGMFHSRVEYPDIDISSNEETNEGDNLDDRD